jgi:hypothetical protein
MFSPEMCIISASTGACCSVFAIYNIRLQQHCCIAVINMCEVFDKNNFVVIFIISLYKISLQNFTFMPLEATWALCSNCEPNFLSFAVSQVAYK